MFNASLLLPINRYPITVDFAMEETINVIALISGGKDSFFSILHCLSNNHRVVALANLYPSGTTEESDLNSHMYQTVGHAIVPLYEQAVGIPLYRRQISGSAINTARDYEPLTGTDSTGEDETESLLLLLDEIKMAHPTANAVCSGAIQSTYQRTRVESVALRLGLLPLSYLWQYPSLPVQDSTSGGLLQDMAAVGLDARIVKVASGGLNETFLWDSLKDEALRNRLGRSVKKFGGSVLGEGGEYETLVVDGPVGIWKYRLQIDEGQRQVVQGEGGESWISFKAGAIIAKNDQADQEDQWRQRMNPPKLWDEAFSRLLNAHDEVISLANERGVDASSCSTSQKRCAPEILVTRSSTTLTMSNVAATGPSTEVQMQNIRWTFLELIRKYDRSAEDVVFTMILLRCMEDFAAVNRIYATIFDKPNPPARVTVACGDNMPLNVNVMLHLRLDESPPDARIGLHVQSRSYWAPANIGPYSQAIAVPFRCQSQETDGASLVYTAGQIPLVPASMQIYDISTRKLANTDLAAFWGQVCLALQHLWRVSKSTRVTWWTYGIAFFVGNSIGDTPKQAMLTGLAWRKLHEPKLWETERPQEDDEIDLWEMKYGGDRPFANSVEELPLPAFRMRQTVEESELGSASNAGLPAFFAVQVDELPRGCKIEWHAPGLAGTNVRVTTYSIVGIEFHDCYIPEYDRTISAASIPASISEESFASYIGAMSVSLSDHQHVIIYTTRPIDGNQQFVPCRSIWSRDGRQLSAAIILDCHGIIKHQLEGDMMRLEKQEGK